MPADLIQDQLHPQLPQQQQQQQNSLGIIDGSHSNAPNNEFIYYPIGTVLNLITYRDFKIPRAEVLFHDPIYNLVIVRYPALSGRQGLFDITLVRLADAKRVELVSYPTSAEQQQQQPTSLARQGPGVTFAAVAAAASAASVDKLDQHQQSSHTTNASCLTTNSEINFDKVRARLSRALRLADENSQQNQVAQSATKE